MGLLKRYLFITLLLFFTMAAYPIDEVTKAAIAAFEYDSSVPSVQTNAGHRANFYAVSCDGNYIFTGNNEEICVRERSTLRVIKTFPFTGATNIVADPYDPDIFYISYHLHYYKTNNVFLPEIGVNWKKGIVTGHFSGYPNHENIMPYKGLFLYNDELGYVPYRGVMEFTANGFQSLTHTSVAVSPGDSLVAFGNLSPLIWDLKKARTVGYLPYYDWVKHRSSSVVSEDQYKLKPTPKLVNLVEGKKSKTGDYMDLRFTDSHTLLMGGMSDEYIEFNLKDTTEKYIPAETKGLKGFRFADVDYFDNWKKAIATHLYDIKVLDLTDSVKEIEEIKVTGNVFESPLCCAVSKNGSYIIGTNYGKLKVYNPVSKIWTDCKKMHSDKITRITMSENKDKVFTIDRSGKMVIWDGVTMDPIVTVMNFFPFGVLSYTPDHYYSYDSFTAPIGLITHISKDNRTYSFEQFDLTKNRPDIIVERLGGDKKYARLLAKSRQKRLRRMNVDESMLEEGFNVPEISVTNIDWLPEVTTERKMTLKLHMNDSKAFLDYLTVKINGVTQHKGHGIKLPRNTHHQDMEYDLNLVSGSNRISVSVTNNHGGRSNEVEMLVECDPADKDSGKRSLWIVSAGVSDYSSSSHKLAYGSKDARDISNVLKSTVTAFDEVKILTLTDNDFTKSSLATVSDFLKDAKHDDAVIMFFAGHGVLDENLDYYLAPVDMNFNVPSEKGILLDSFIGLLDGIEPIKRYVLVDACHSGFLDKEDYIAENSLELNKSAGKGIRFRNVGGIRERSEEETIVSALANDLFTDLTFHAGVTFISSSSGEEVSMESDEWGNGLFTYTFKNLLESIKNTSLASGVTLEGCVTRIIEEVKRASHYRQNPRMYQVSSNTLQLCKQQ